MSFIYPNAAKFVTYVRQRTVANTATIYDFAICKYKMRQSQERIYENLR